MMQTVRIDLFIACYNDTLFPQTGKAVVTVLERLGHRVEFRAAQTCCGQMHHNTGYQNEAAQMLKHFVKVFDGAETVCVPSGSCVAHIREHFPKIAARLSDNALITAVETLLPRVFEFTELLIDRLGVTETGAYFPHAVTLHTTCHSLRGIQVGDRPTRLLKSVRGLNLIDLPDYDQCCGFGGTFSIKNAGVSAAMLNDKVRCILETGAEYCTAVDNSCLMQIAGALDRQRAPVRCLHLAEILATTGPEARG